MQIKLMVEAGTDVYERVKAMDDSKIKDPLKKQVEAVLSTLNDCKKLETNGLLTFYGAKGELNSIGQAAMHLQKSINATRDNFQILVSKSAIQVFKRKRAEGKVESFIQDLEDLTDKLNTLISWEKGIKVWCFFVCQMSNIKLFPCTDFNTIRIVFNNSCVSTEINLPEIDIQFRKVLLWKRPRIWLLRNRLSPKNCLS